MSYGFTLKPPVLIVIISKFKKNGSKSNFLVNNLITVLQRHCTSDIWNDKTTVNDAVSKRFPHDLKLNIG